MREYESIHENNKDHIDLLKHLSTLSAMMIAILAALGTRKGIVVWGVVILGLHLIVTFLLMNVLLNQNGYLSKMLCKTNIGDPQGKAEKCFPIIDVLSPLSEILFLSGVILIVIYFVFSPRP